MIRAVLFWSSLGIIQLLIASYKDMRTMKVDDRHNYFMTGVSVALLTHFTRGIWYILALVLLNVLLMLLIHRFKAFGDGDLKALGWIFLGLGIISPYKLGWFVVFFSVVTIFYNLLKVKVFKVKHPTPFFPVILIVFAFNVWFMGLL